MNDRAIHIASKNGHKDVIEALIKAGCEIDAKGSGNWTALIFASSYGFLSCCQLLLTAGCDMEATNKVKLKNRFLRLLTIEIGCSII